jgi:hypothetical protein
LLFPGNYQRPIFSLATEILGFQSDNTAVPSLFLAVMLGAMRLFAFLDGSPRLGPI